MFFATLGKFVNVFIVLVIALQEAHRNKEWE
jgi:hypothetical protein